MSIMDCHIQQLQHLAKIAPNLVKFIVVDIRTGCWLWKGKLNRNGYGRLNWRHPVAHRVVFGHLLGKQFPLFLMLVLDHTCPGRRRHCCNPFHLEPVTSKVNTLRGNAVLFTKEKQHDDSSRDYDRSQAYL
jgi:hypothetical protein